MPRPAGGEDAIADGMVEHADLARSDRRSHLALELGGNAHVVGEIDDVVDARRLHCFERRDVSGEQQRLVRRDDAHVAEVEVMELPTGEVARGVVEHVAHGQLVRLERLLVDVRLEG